MKTRILSNTIGGVLLLAGVTVQAQFTAFNTSEGAGPYARLEIGGSVWEDGRLTEFNGPANSKVDYAAGFSFNGAFGYDFNQYFGVDLELGLISAEIDHAEDFFLDDTMFYTLPFLVNARFSWPIPRTIAVAYAGAGVGGAMTVFDTDGFGDGDVVLFGDDADVVFAWQAFAGLRFNLNKQMALGLGYKYFVTQDSTFSYSPLFPGSGPDLRLGLEGVQTHSVLFTFQFKF